MAYYASAEGDRGRGSDREMEVLNCASHGLDRGDAHSPWQYIAKELESEGSTPRSSPSVSPVYELVASLEPKPCRETDCCNALPKITDASSGRPRAGTPVVPPLYLKGMADLDKLVTMESKQTAQYHANINNTRGCTGNVSATLGEGNSSSRWNLLGCGGSGSGNRSRKQSSSWMSCSGIGCGGGNTRGMSIGGGGTSPNSAFDPRSP
jgi:hypothetical protein